MNLNNSTHTIETTLILLQTKIQELFEINETIVNHLQKYPTQDSHRKKLSDSNIQDQWLDDTYITPYINSINREVAKVREDVLFVDPSVTQLIKLSTAIDTYETLTSLSFDTLNFSIFCLNNSSGPEDRGLHWSLLVISRPEETVYHLDSITKLNEKYAKMLANKISPSYKFMECPVPQQTSNYECGLHMLVNCRYISTYLSKINPKQKLLNLLLHGQDIQDHDNNTVKADFSSCEDGFNKESNESSLFESVNESTYNVQASKSRYSKRKIKPFSKYGNDYIVNFKMKKDQNKTNKQDSICTITTHLTPTISTSNKFGILSETNSYINIVNEEDKDEQRARLLEGNSSCLNPPQKCLNTKKKNSKSKSDERPYILNKKGKTQSEIDHELNNNYQQNSKQTNLSDQMKSQKHLSQRKSEIKIISDSHGRHISTLLNETLEQQLYRIYGSVKPNGKLNNVLHNFESEAKHMTNGDYLIVIGGTNDVNPNLNIDIITSELEKKIKSNSVTNIIITGLPYRYDLPFMNNKIKEINICFEKMASNYKNVTFLSLHTFKRSYYTNHGLHLNKYGKYKLSQLLSNVIKDKFVNKRQNIPVHITQKRTVFLEKSIVPSVKH